jgi:hypothetical protein
MIIEYIYGQMKCYTGIDLPYTILANDSYSNLLGYIRQQKGFGGNNHELYRVGSSCCRFTHVAERMRDYDPHGTPIINYAFDILNDVQQGGTQYQTVYDIKDRTIHYKSRNSNATKTIRMKDFDFDCRTPVLMAPISSNKGGNIRNAFDKEDVPGVVEG